MRATYPLMIFCCWLLVLPVGAQATPTPQPGGTLTIFAASSLNDALRSLGGAFIERYPNANLIYNFAGSSTLAAQLAQGAPADVFASANRTQMQNVVDAGRIHDAAVQVFATNSLTIIVPADNPADMRDAGDLAQSGLLLVLAAPSVPVREYADTLLQHLSDIYGADYADAVLRNLISEEDNVRRVVAKIALGEADAGIVYQTDITPDVADALLQIPLPEGSSPLAEYPIAPLADATNPTLAHAFVQFVQSEAGQAILAEAGFGLPNVMPSAPEATPEPDTP